MATNYDDAVTELYRAPHAGFVAERKRLGAELKASGDAASAARLAKLARPPVSAWVVNQLWWQEREAFTALMSAAERLRNGDLEATAEHRQATAALRERASFMLETAGHSTSDATLRRVAATLSAIAVAGGFDPDPPGALATDRDPPGFDAIGDGPPSDLTERRNEEKRRKLEEERAQQLALREGLERELLGANNELEMRRRELDLAREKLNDAERRVRKAEALAAEIAERLAAFARATDR